MDAVALTDLGQMFGSWNFYREAMLEGVKPILGVEAFVAPRGRKVVNPMEKPGTLLLLASDIIGYHNITRLVSRSNTEGFLHFPRIDMELLKDHGKGLIVLSAGLMGEIPRLIQGGNIKEATLRVKNYQGLFGERFYLELCNNKLAFQKDVNNELASIGKSLGVPLACASECYYLNKEDMSAFKVLECIRTRQQRGAMERFSEGGDMSFKTPQEMKRLFADYPEALANTLSIASQVTLEFPKRRHYALPRPDIGESAKNDADYQQKMEAYFKRRTLAGLETRLSSIKPPLEKADPDLAAFYKMRLRLEIESIIESGSAQYILIVADLVANAKEQGCVMGPGKGNAVASLVLWALGVTEVDPVEHNLIFESFLNLDAKDFPKVEIEVPIEKVRKVIEDISDTYGGSHFAAHSLKLSRLTGRSLVREVGLVFGFPLKEMDELCGMLPTHSGIDLKMALKEISLFRDAAQNNPNVKKIIEFCLALENLPRSAAVNENSLVVSERLLRDRLPLFLDLSTMRKRTPSVVVQYDSQAVEENGLLSLEVFPQKVLSLQATTLRLLKEKGIEPELNKIPTNDPTTLALLAKGNTKGIPFLENYWIVEHLASINNLRFDDLVNLRAIYPPLFHVYAVQADYLAARKKRLSVPITLDKLVPILSSTYGFILFKEQLVEMIEKLTLIPTSEAELILRAFSQPQDPRAARFKELLSARLRLEGLAVVKGREILERILFFAPRSPWKHTALSLALQSYRTAFLKAHYPTEFIDAYLSFEDANPLEREKALKEWRSLNLRLVPPPTPA
jgi:DNA polymerase-3 subunit alpha